MLNGKEAHLRFFYCELKKKNKLLEFRLIFAKRFLVRLIFVSIKREKF